MEGRESPVVPSAEERPRAISGHKRVFSDDGLEELMHSASDGTLFCWSKGRLAEEDWKISRSDLQFGTADPITSFWLLR